MKTDKNSEESDGYLFLKETAKEYIEKHDKRLKEFLDEYEAEVMDYIKKEMEYFENTLYDVQNSEGSHDGHSVTGFDNFSLAYELVCNIGAEKFLYSTKAKLKFLESQIVVNSPFQNQHSNHNENPKDVNTLNWQGTQLELTELTKALIQSNKLNSELSQTEIFRRLKLFFNVSDFNENDKIRDIRNRTNTLTPFINKLEIGLTNWINKKD